MWYSTTHINILPICQIKVDDYPGWAGKFMQFRKFVQIQAFFHPQTTKNKLDDKYHQIRYGIQKLNSAAKRCFIPGKELSFDKGGILGKSWSSSMRQYNNSKTDKYEIFFSYSQILLVDTTSSFILTYIKVKIWKISSSQERYGIYWLHKISCEL